jgi:hypothetical protein
MSIISISFGCFKSPSNVELALFYILRTLEEDSTFHKMMLLMSCPSQHRIYIVKKPKIMIL